MADTIIEVHSISAASEWYFQDFGAASLADLRPVACFALVLTFDPAYPALGVSKSIIPLSVDEVGVSLMGTEVPAKTADLIGKAEAQALFA